MAITLTIETGAVVAGANTFISLANFKAYLTNRARSFTTYTDDQLSAALIRAGQYLNGLNWMGRKTGRTNPMCWPRESDGDYPESFASGQEITGGVIDRNGYEIEINEVPQEAIDAQCEGAWLEVQGTSLQPSLERGGAVQSEKVDMIQTTYFSGAPGITRHMAIESLLAGLLMSTLSIETTRA